MLAPCIIINFIACTLASLVPRNSLLLLFRSRNILQTSGAVAMTISASAVLEYGRGLNFSAPHLLSLHLIVLYSPALPSFSLPLGYLWLDPASRGKLPKNSASARSALFCFNRACLMVLPTVDYLEPRPKT